MNDTAQYLLLLAISVGLTFLIGRLLVRAGEPFLQEVFQDTKVTRSVNLLLSVLFHLITLGVVAIISVIDINNDDPVQSLVVKLGVVLVVLGIAYGISMLVLIRVRERRRADQISEQVSERLADRGVAPGPGAGGIPIKTAPPIPPATPPAPPAAQPAAPGTQPATAAPSSTRAVPAPAAGPAGTQPGSGQVPPAQS